MGAIKIHHTATSDEGWDAGEAVARLRNDGNEAYYRQAFAWQDPEGNPDTKSAYKFPHHDISQGGDVGAANIRACRAAIASLNGARGGADIPDADRPGVYAHVAAHLRDAGVEPAELKSTSIELERRSYFGELRAERSDGEQPRIVGYAAIFNSWYEEPQMAFRERVLPGAFAKTIQEADVRALWNHNPDYVLGRVSSGTLTLREDERGLWMEVLPPDTAWARDLMKSIERGDITQQSFGFRTIRDNWQRGEDGWEERELVEVELFDVSPVTFPAYTGTLAQVRNLLEKRHAEVRPEPPADGHSRSREPAKKSLEILRKKLDLATVEIRKER